MTREPVNADIVRLASPSIEMAIQGGKGCRHRRASLSAARPRRAVEDSMGISRPFPPAPNGRQSRGVA